MQAESAENSDLEPISTYETLNGIAYQKIVSALRTGRLEPGSSLHTRTLAKQLGVSSTPVREALAKLVAQNALDVTPSSRAAVVPQLTRELLSEMYEIRDILDRLAARHAAEQISADEAGRLARLASELDEMETAGRTKEAEYLDRSEAFFLGVFAAARRPILYTLLENLWLRSGVILALLSKSPPSDFTISRYRHDLAAALADHDPDGAEAAIGLVLATTRSMLFTLLEGASAPPGGDSERRTAPARDRTASGTTRAAPRKRDRRDPRR